MDEVKPKKENPVIWINPNGEDVAIRKSFDGWRVVYPMKNRDGSTNWRNVILGGNYWKLAKALLALVLILLVFQAYNHDLSICKNTIKNLDAICSQRNAYNIIKNVSYNPLEINLTINNPLP